MRNLKRALSLALASVMLLGMMVVGTSAASYPDVDSEDNVEAIAVLNAVGAMIGDDNGKFNPDQNVTRNEMAAVMARLLLGADAEKYVGNCPFTDVPGWAQKYVAACYDNKVINGRSATVYDGSATVNAQEAATMMLRALGYEKITGTGSNWAQPVVAKANEIRLFKGVTGSVTAPMTRNDIAQLSLNTLKATMVTASKGNTVTVGGVEITSDVVWTDRADPDNYRYDGKNDNKLQLCEYLYEGKLELTGDTDDFGAPANLWQYKKADVIKVTKDPVAAFTAKTSAADVLKELKGYTYSDAKISDKDNALVTYVAGKTGNGKLVQVFANDDVIRANATDVVEIPYSLGKVTNISTNKDGDVTYTVTKEKGEIGGRSGTIYADADKTDTVVIEGSVAKDDIVTYAKGHDTSADKDVLYIYPTTTFNGVQSARNADKATITVDGKTYDVAEGITDGGSSKILTTDFDNSTDTCTFYVDQFGYVVKSTVIDGSSEYAVVDQIRYVNDGAIGSDKSVEARLVFTDGTSKIVKVTQINGVKVTDAKVKAKTAEGEDATVGISPAADKTGSDVTKIVLPTTVGENIASYTASALSAKVVKFSKDGDNYKLTYGVTTNSGLVSSGNKATEKGVPTFSYGSSETGTKDTIYIIKTDDAKYSVYTGYQNVTTVKAPTNGTNVAYSTKDSKVNVVYIDAYGTDGAAGNKAEVGDTTNEIVYILDYKAYSEYKNDSGDTRYTYTAAALNGVEKDIVSKEAFGANGFYEVKLTDNDEVDSIVDNSATNGVPGTPANKWAKANVTKTMDDPDQIYAGKAYIIGNKDKVYVIDDKTFSTGDGTSAEVGDTVFFKVKGTTAGSAKDDITMEIVYIVKAAAGEATVPSSMGAAEIKKLFTEQGKDKVTVTGALASPEVPAGKTLVVDTMPTGTLTLEEGSTLELGANVTGLLPTLADGSKGTIKTSDGKTVNTCSDPSNPNTIFANATKYAVEKGATAGDWTKTDATGSAPATYTMTVKKNAVSFTGGGKIGGFGNDVVGGSSGTGKSALYAITLPSEVVNSENTRSAASAVAKHASGTKTLSGTADLDGEVTLLLSDNIESVTYTFDAGEGDDPAAATVIINFVD